MTDSATIQGGCFCGRIRFQFEAGDYLVANCHCHMCRQTSGAPFTTWVVVPKTAFQYLQGSPKVLVSSFKGRRQFCQDCGTPMVFTTTDRPDDLDITTGCLTNPEDFVPTVAVHEASKLNWLHQTECTVSD